MTPTGRSLVGAAALALLVGCAPGGRSAGYGIVGGEPTTDFEAVVTLYWLGGFLCSGVVVEPRTVLTAAHCLYGFPDDDAGLSVRFGPQAADPERELLAESFEVHPDYSTSVTHDLARVRLSEDAPVAPTGWSTAELGDGLLGRSLDIVGFGETVAGEADPDLFRRRADVVVDEVTDLQIKWYGDEANLCDGDSGGAAFEDGALLGVLVEGDTLCAEWGAALRLDALGGWLDGSATGDDDDTGLALPDDDDDDVGSVDCGGCSAGGGGSGGLLLLVGLAVRRSSPRCFVGQRSLPGIRRA